MVVFMGKENLGALIIGTAIGAALGGLSGIALYYSTIGTAISTTIGAIGGSYIGSRYYKPTYQN